jgi:hypothetical protein
VQCILEPTEHPQALDAFVSMVLSPAGKLSFDEVLQRVECPVCLAYGELVDTYAAEMNIRIGYVTADRKGGCCGTATYRYVIDWWWVHGVSCCLVIKCCST